MRRGPTDIAPSPLAGEGGGEGRRKVSSCLSGSYTRGVLPVQTRSEILRLLIPDVGS